MDNRWRGGNGCAMSIGRRLEERVVVGRMPVWGGGCYRVDVTRPDPMHS